MENQKKKHILAGVIVLLIISNIFFIIKTSSLSGELFKIRNQENKFERDEKIVFFLGIFVDKVLSSNSEIDFENRLALENAVRATENKEIIELWQKFAGSKTESEAQESVRKLLEISIKQVSSQQ